MKIFKKLFCCLFALSISGAILYADILFAFPEEITMYQSQSHQSRLGAGVSIGNIPENVCAISPEKTVTPLKTGSYSAVLKVGEIPYRKIKLNITKQQSICASGQLIGLRIYNRGLIVTNLAPITCGGSEISPARNAGILPGDVILEINGVFPKTGDDVSKLLTENTALTVKRNNSLKILRLQPVRDDSDGMLKLGLWVRDSTAGVGTLTYYIPETYSYGALGHGISDSDTGITFEVASGTIENSRVVSVTKGKRGAPGQICGSFSAETEISGTVLKNCEAGIFGSIFPHTAIDAMRFPIGVMSQVKTGKATILSTVDDTVKEYDINILRTMPYGAATKGLAIEITDPELLEKTGGIVQGMSGSPIIQNGRLIGAVTHVLVNDPTRGYGIFIENMLAEAEKISD